MALLFHINPQRDYCIAKFFVKKEYALTWFNLISLACPLELPDDVERFTYKKYTDNENYIFTVVDIYINCLSYLDIYIKHHKDPSYLFPQMFEKDEPEHMRMGYNSKEEYEEFLRIDTALNYLFTPVTRLNTYSHYEDYIPEFE
ncbi:hypothetical protein NIES4071_81190 [Calothrix sp. NIES-4071]|nr:hypothetical protein NIES4071_81190 [Calothrix sp. NIES-4071]BAZ62389.1 hypothetical protein NIES4105_81120 [Calothrix sp. NIES-4105]